MSLKFGKYRRRVMRFCIRLSKNVETIPFNYYYQLAGIFHNWVGPNDLHDLMSLYNVGALHDRRTHVHAKGLEFPSGADWTIGVYNEEIAERLIAGLLLKPFEFYGMKILHVKRQEPPVFKTSTNYYWASAPILTRWKAQPGQSREHLIYTDPRTTVTLTQTLRHKADEAGLAMYWKEDTHVAFDKEYPKAKTKLIKVKNTENRANLCPVIINAHEKIQYLSWVVGVGDSTGIGFGSLNYARSL